MSDVLKPLERLYQNAVYTGDDAQDWTPEADKKQIEEFIKQHEALTEQVEHLKACKEFEQKFQARFIDEYGYLVDTKDGKTYGVEHVFQGLEKLKKSHAELSSVIEIMESFEKKDFLSCGQFSGYSQKEFEVAKEVTTHWRRMLKERALSEAEKELCSFGKECKEIINENITSLYTTY